MAQARDTGAARGRWGERTAEQLRDHYEIEKELADRLRRASKEQRRSLYSEVYDELFRRVANHPQLVRRQDPNWQRDQVAYQMKLLSRFVTPETVFLEVGAGDCALSLHVAQRAGSVYAVDVSHEIADQHAAPDHFRLIISDGTSIPVPPGSVTLAYSNQLMEHLHPDDALEQLRNLHRALAPGGRYLCVTPNRLSGPHDISKYFDRVATGFHLAEYTAGDLSRLFREVGFHKLTGYVNIKGVYRRCPLRLLRLLETTLSMLPFSPRRRVANNSTIAGILGLVLVGHKP